MSERAKKISNFISTIITIVVLFFIIIAMFQRKPVQKAQEAHPTSAVISSPSPARISPTNAPVVKGSMPLGIAFYDKVMQMVIDGKITGVPYTENPTDAVVDINPESHSVQIGLKYPTITGDMKTATARGYVRSDFDAIKRLAEKDSSVIDPDTRELDLVVLTFYDATGKARGEVQQQLPMDTVPQFSFWK